VEHMFNTFLHSIAWHSGTKLVNMVGLPIVVIFVAYGAYKLYRRM